MRRPDRVHGKEAEITALLAAVVSRPVSLGTQVKQCEVGDEAGALTHSFVPEESQFLQACCLGNGVREVDPRSNPARTACAFEWTGSVCAPCAYEWGQSGGENEDKDVW